MQSPFPGMNPYLEQFWGDMQARLITYARDQIQTLLPSDLRARCEEREFVESRDDAITQGYIKILDLTAGRRVLTVIEVLSPYNKVAGPGRKLYTQRQQECRDGCVNLVEIDLVRGCPWVLSVPEGFVPASHQTTYHACVFRAVRSRWDVYPVPLRERLPVIAIPLRETDADTPLDLQALLDQCYRKGAYDEDIDYDGDPIPSLDQQDAEWLNELLRAKRRRK